MIFLDFDYGIVFLWISWNTRIRVNIIDEENDYSFNLFAHFLFAIMTNTLDVCMYIILSCDLSSRSFNSKYCTSLHTILYILSISIFILYISMWRMVLYIVVFLYLYHMYSIYVFLQNIVSIISTIKRSTKELFLSIRNNIRFQIS